MQLLSKMQLLATHNTAIRYSTLHSPSVSLRQCYYNWLHLQLLSVYIQCQTD